MPKPPSNFTIAKLSRRLRELRKRHDLTQEEFAEIAGVSYKFYQQIESGHKKQIWLETIERLAHAYGLESWELIAPNTPQKTHLRRKSR